MTVSMPLLDELPEILLQDGCVGREEMEKAVEEQKLTGGGSTRYWSRTATSRKRR